MKKLGAFFLALTFLLSGISLAQATAATLVGEATGFGGTITVELSMDGEKITGAKITGDAETPAVGGAALDTLAQQIVDKQGTEIDGVAGATVTSTAVKEAVAAALAKAAGGAAEALAFTPGTYTGAAPGMWRDITVSVTVDAEKILSVDVTDCQDTPVVAAAAIEEVPARIVARQSLAVDAATGATVTSGGILAAAKSALSQATDSMAALTAPLPEAEIAVLPDQSYDVVVVGAGGAGIAAALEVARTSDYSVLLLEKEAWMGGSTALSGGGITVVNTPKNRGEELDAVFSPDGLPMDCTPEDIVTYYRHKTETLSKRPEGMEINEELVRRVFERSATYYPYLMENGLDQRYGIPAKTAEEMDMPGKGIFGLIKGTPYSAGEMWSKWFSKLAADNGAELRVNARVTELIVNDGKVDGVVVTTPESTYRVNAKKVILTTGGFANNQEMLCEYNPQFANIADVGSFCAPGCTGDALELVKPVDAATDGFGMIMQFGVTHRNAFDTTLGDPLQNFFLYVDQNGERFVDELAWYYDKTDAIMDLEHAMCYTIIGPNFPFSAKHGEDMTFDDWMSILIENGWAKKGDTVSELAEAMGMDAAKLQESVDFYNERQKTTPTDRFGTPLNPLEEGQPIYAIQMQCVALDTMYGLKQDAQFRVLNTAGEPIPNLYAAGWVGGGNYMLQKYYCTTNAIAIAVYGGSLAGEEAVNAINAQK